MPGAFGVLLGALVATLRGRWLSFGNVEAERLFKSGSLTEPEYRAKRQELIPEL